MRKHIAKLSILLAIIIALSAFAIGCSQEPSKDDAKQGEDANKVEDDKKDDEKDDAKTSDDESEAGDLIQGTGEELIIYTNSGSDGRGDWLKERAEQDGFKIEYVEAGAGEIANRLLAEKNAPIADVVFGLNTMTYETLKQEDLLVQYVPSWSDEVDEGLSDKEGYYHAIVKQAILLVYNSDVWSEEDAPTDWLDLGNKEEFKGKYEANDSLGGGTTRTVLSGILVRYKDPEGELGISQEGWDEIEKFYQNGSTRLEDTDLYARMADENDEVVAGQIWSSGIEAREEQYGVTSGYMNPEIGVPFVVEQVAIIKDTKNLEEAQRFVDWFGSAQIQGEWAEKFSTTPANNNALDKANEFARYIAETFKAQDIDWAFVAENVDAWMEKIELEYTP
ncbi:MAG: extracellular solute-binding protein [Clostridiales bacterium]|nr:extracellular solute-binding protein [Clostridiales bacterium]